MLSRRGALAIFAAPVLSAQEKSPKMFGDAEAYERFMGRWSRLLAPLLIDFSGVSDAGHILDVGSGTGQLTLALLDRKPAVRVTGIDPSKEYVAYATSRTNSNRATFQTGDAQQLSFADASFDASLSLLVFNFIPDAARALAELRRVTRPGGRIAAAVWEYSARMQMLRIFWDAAVSIDPAAEGLDEKHMKLCHAGELEQLWKQGGLAEVRAQPLDITMRFASFADYWEPFLLGQGPAGAYARRLEPDRQSRLRNELVRRLSASGEAAPFTLPARALAVCGTVPPR